MVLASQQDLKNALLSYVRKSVTMDVGLIDFLLAKLPADTQCIEQAPCLACPVEHMCSVESAYSPNNCNLIEEWALISFPSNSPQLSLNRYEQLQNGTREKELVVREVKPATRRRAQRIAKNSKKRSFN